VAEVSLEAALEYAEDSKRPDMRLLAHSERFNSKAHQLPLPELEAEASDILARARSMKYVYVQGRVFLSLAIAYRNVGHYEDVFMCAQQSLVYFLQEDHVDMAGQAVGAMLGALTVRSGHFPPYRNLLFSYLEQLNDRSLSPRFHGATSHQHSLLAFRTGDYDAARRYLLEAYCYYRSFNYRRDQASLSHMLGLIQSHRQNWAMAERHLKASRQLYRHQKNLLWRVNSRHALEYIPFLQGDYQRAVVRLQKARRLAWALPEDWGRDRVIAEIQKDIDEALRRLDEQK
jgi:hypothetical protein